MYLKCHSRLKDGKELHYYSITEKLVCAGGHRVERHVFYLGEINDSQKEGWLKLIEAFDAGSQEQIGSSVLERPWQQARPSVQLKLLAQQQELIVLVKSQSRVSKERAIRRRKLKNLWARLK